MFIFLNNVKFSGCNLVCHALEFFFYGNYYYLQTISTFGVCIDWCNFHLKLGSWILQIICGENRAW